MNFSEFLQLFKEGKVSAKSHMKNLLEMAYIDGNFDDSENILLSKLAKKHNISENQLKEIKKNPDSVEFEVPKKDKDKFEQLYDLVAMMLADEYVDTEEFKLCVLYAKKFGYKESNAHEIVDTIAGNLKHGQSSAETMKRVELLIN